ncbi:MAG: hypothetical protein ABIQ35_11570 [Verrucomicrobiota bacterium]
MSTSGVDEYPWLSVELGSLRAMVAVPSIVDTGQHLRVVIGRLPCIPRVTAVNLSPSRRMRIYEQHVCPSQQMPIQLGAEDLRAIDRREFL